MQNVSEMFAWLYWDPNPVVFYLPLFRHPILWYGVLFALGFLIGFYLLKFLFLRFLCFYPEFTRADIVDWKVVLENKKDTEKERVAAIRELNSRLNQKISNEKKPSFLLRFAKRFLSSEGFNRLANRLYLERSLRGAVHSLKRKSRVFTEHLTIYMMVGTVLGARLGHIFFYEKWSDYLMHPLEILKTWEGGLASHGAVIGILGGIGLFLLKNRKEYPMLSILQVIDLIVIPSLYAGVLIRLGNFINQEILGTVTRLPWAIIFAHPAGGLPPLPRHPAQLYEALFYFLLFLVFFRLFPKLFFPTGRMTALCLISVFTFRFFIEFVKEKQSYYLIDHVLTMGQYLSLPYILLGVILLFLKKSTHLSPDPEKHF